MEDFELCEDFSLLPPAVRTWYVEHLAQAPDTSGLYADSLTKGDPSFSDGAVDFAAVALLTSLCPKLSTLNFTQYQHATAFAFCAPASVLSLRDVEASYWDTEGGFDLELLAPLFRAAPNLRSLRLAQVGCEEPLDKGLRLDYLMDLDMYSCCIPGDELIHIIRLCPNLKRLRYECGGACYGEEQFGPLEAANIILEHAISLRTVELCLDDMDQFSDGYEDLKENEDQARLVLARHRIEYKPVYYN